MGLILPSFCSYFCSKLLDPKISKHLTNILSKVLKSIQMQKVVWITQNNHIKTDHLHFKSPTLQNKTNNLQPKKGLEIFKQNLHSTILMWSELFTYMYVQRKNKVDAPWKLEHNNISLTKVWYGVRFPWKISSYILVCQPWRLQFGFLFCSLWNVFVEPCILNLLLLCIYIDIYNVFSFYIIKFSISK